MSKNRDKLTTEQRQALQLKPGDAVRVILTDGGHDGILLNRPAGPGDLWEVAVDGGVMALNPYSASFQAIARRDEPGEAAA